MCQDLEVPSASRTYRGVTPEQRVAVRRTRLVEAGIDVLGVAGYRAATVGQICARAGLSKRYFYESFADSEALLLACYERCADEIHQAMVSTVLEAAGTGDEFRAALAGYFRAIDEDQRHARITLLEILGVSPAVDTAYATQTARFATSIQAMAASAFEASSLPASQLHVVAQGMVGAITTVATQWLLDGRRRPRTELIDATHLLAQALLNHLPQT